MIQILIDKDNLKEDINSAFVVTDEGSYIESRQRIKEAIYNKKEITVIIKAKKMKNWYESLQDYPDVRIEEVSIKAILIKELKAKKTILINLPLADREIRDLDLLNKAKKFPPVVRIRSIKDIENWVLSVCVDECFGDTKGTMEHISSLSSYYLSKDEPSNSILRRMIEKKKQEWRNSSLGDIYKWLFVNPRERTFIIYAHQILEDYNDSMKRKILDEAELNLITDERFIKCIGQIPPFKCLKHPKKKEFSDIIERKWKSSLKDRFSSKENKEEFEKLIREAITKMSGIIDGEINALFIFIKEKPVYFSEALFRIISAKFNEAQFKEKVKGLEDIIFPDTPTLPSKEWDFKRISKWTIEEYFPYKKKQSKLSDKRDKLVEECIFIFEEWLYNNYPALKNEFYPLIYGTWSVIKEYISQGFQILWVIIDNLSYLWIKDLLSAFKENGFYPSEIEPRLSMLPSETRISKTALIRGKLPEQIDKDKYQKYQALFEDYCKENHIESCKIIQTTTLRNPFKGNKLENHKITSCIINKLDVASHESFWDLEDDIKAFFRNIAKSLKEFVPLELSNKKFKLVISTDHGCCTIPLNIKGHSKHQGLSREKEYKRFVYIDSKTTLDKNWHFLDKTKFGLIESIGVVKGYGFIGRRRPKGLVHGGMTPEETIVPHIEFSLRPIKIKRFKCIHESNPIPLGLREHIVKLLFVNPNPYEITNLYVDIPSHSIEIEIERIPANDEIIKEIKIFLPKDTQRSKDEGNALLAAYYNFNCLEDRYKDKMDIKIKVRKIVSKIDTAEELFDDIKR